MGAQVAVAAVAAARIAVELQMSQDDAADAAASCSERVTQAMGQNADVQAQAADAAAIIAGYLVASHVGEGPIAAGLEAGRAMRAAGSTAREQLLAAGDAAMHAASAANVPTELQLVAAATAIGRTAAVGRIRSSRVEYCKLITELAEQASTMPGHGTDEATTTALRLDVPLWFCSNPRQASLASCWPPALQLQFFFAASTGDTGDCSRGCSCAGRGPSVLFGHSWSCGCLTVPEALEPTNGSPALASPSARIPT